MRRFSYRQSLAWPWVYVRRLNPLPSSLPALDPQPLQHHDFLFSTKPFPVPRANRSQWRKLIRVIQGGPPGPTDGRGRGSRAVCPGAGCGGGVSPHRPQSQITALVVVALPILSVVFRRFIWSWPAWRVAGIMIGRVRAVLSVHRGDFVELRLIYLRGGL